MCSALQGVLQPAELEFLLQQRHAGTAVLQALGECVQASHMQPLQKIRIDENITVMQVRACSAAVAVPSQHGGVMRACPQAATWCGDSSSC
jgi:hypothetical protein